MNEVIYAAAPDRSRWRDRDWAGEVTAAGLFGDVEHAVFDHVHEFPREALDAHLWSYATIASLPEEERLRVFDAVAELLDGDPSLRRGDALALPFAIPAYRARRL
jgi:hypothetical protein